MCEMTTSDTESHTSAHLLELTTDRGLLLPVHWVRGVGNRSQQPPSPPPPQAEGFGASLEAYTIEQHGVNTI